MSNNQRGGPTNRPGGNGVGNGEQPPPPVPIEAAPLARGVAISNEAMEYLNLIKRTFTRNIAVYNKFLDIMKEFKAKTIEVPIVIEQVTDLLFEHPSLVLKFNKFLPYGYEILKTEWESGYSYLIAMPNEPPPVISNPQGENDPMHVELC